MAVAGVGTQFLRWSGAAWEALAEINSINGPTMTRSTIDTTALDTSGGYRTFITGFRDGGTVSLTMNFTRTAWELMKTDFEADAANEYMIIFPDDDNTTLEFSGLVTECPINTPTDDKITSNVSIKISGTVTVESGSQAAA